MDAKANFPLFSNCKADIDKYQCTEKKPASEDVNIDGFINIYDFINYFINVYHFINIFVLNFHPVEKEIGTIFFFLL